MTSAPTMEKQEVTTLLFLSSVYFVIGMLLCWFALDDGESVINVFYFTVVTMTSIGYGDIKPTTDGGKLLVAAYCFIGPCFFWGAIDLLVSVLVMKLEVWYFRGLRERGKGIMKTAFSISFILIDLVIGICGIRNFEKNLGWCDTIYLVCITTTTVGFGDISFQTNGGRLFASVWLLLSVPLFMRACANLRAPRRKLSGAILVSPDNDNTDRTNGSNSMVTGVLMSFSNTRSLKWALLNLVSNGGIVYIVHVMSNPPMDIKGITRDASGEAACYNRSIKLDTDQSSCINLLKYN
uniref:two-pore potassium channel 3-like n=1 Tax=Fragaria vesca subsp. vesca TaxID=101020 RepID=UPI0005CA269F|nr:PREDICTED: two-pore potassium channel 3-like [Fragaria vesca subsp. vesca]